MEKYDGPIDIDRAMQVAVSAARGAGDLINTTFRRWFCFVFSELLLQGIAEKLRFSGIKDMKKTETDPVTETDLACEALIKKMICAEFPDHEFLGEESYEVFSLWEILGCRTSS
jgi:hypothetical protein